MPDVDDQHSGWGFLVVLVVVVLSAPVLQTAYAGAVTQSVVQGEPHTVTFSGDVSVSEDALRYGDSVSVVDPDENATLGRDSDYTWDSANGTLTFLNTSRLESGERVEVDYVAESRPAATAATWSIISAVLGLQTLYVLVAALNALRAWFGWFEGGLR